MKRESENTGRRGELNRRLRANIEQRGVGFNNQQKDGLKGAEWVNKKACPGSKGCKKRVG